MIRTLVLLVALCNIAFMTFNTVIGPIGRVVGMPEWQIGFMMSVSGICWMMSSRSWGRHSDGVGRYRVMQQGLIGFTVLFALLSIAVALGLAKVIDAAMMFFSLLFTRGALGAFYAALPVASQAMIADSLAPEKRAGGLAALGAASGVGMILGPAIGGVLGAYSLILPLLFATVLSAAAVLLVYKAGTSLKAVELEHRSGPRSSPPMSLTDRRLRWPMAVALCAMFCVISAQVNTAFFIIDQFAYQPAAAVSATGLVLTSVGLALITAQLLVRKLNSGSNAARWTPIRLIATGTAISSVAFLAGSFSPSVPWMAAGYFGAGFGMGMVFPAMSAAASGAVSAQEQGIAAGTMAAAQAAGMVLAPLLSTALYHIAPQTPFWAAAAVLLVVSLRSATMIDQPEHQYVSPTIGKNG